MVIKSNSDHGRQTKLPHLETPTWCELAHASTPWIDWERRKITEVEVPVVRDPSRPNPFFADWRNIHHPINFPAGWRDAVNFLVIRFRRIEIASHRHHAVPSSVWLPIVSRWSWICGRVCRQE